MATTHIRVKLNEKLQILAGKVPIDEIQVPIADVLPLLDAAGREELALRPADLACPNYEVDFAPELAEATPEIVAEQLALRAQARAAAQARRAEESARDAAAQAQREQDEAARVANQDAEHLAAIAAGRVVGLDSDGDPAEYYWRKFFERHPEALELARASHARAASEKAAQVAVLCAAAGGFVVAHVPEYKRAAEDGCDVRHRATEAVLAWLDERGAVATYSDDAHTCPSATAYAKLDEIKRLIGDAPGNVLSRAEVSITRSDVSPARGERDIRTCVHVWCELPWGGPDVDRSFVAESDVDDE